MQSRFRAAALFLGLFLAATQARAQSCFAENECTFEKPNILVIMDYSSSMVLESFGSSTRWQAQVDAARSLLQNRGLTDNMHIALARFGHDPLAAAGTTLTGDASSPPITDGFAIDVGFDGPNGAYRDCNAAALRRALNGLPEPPGAAPLIGTWTRGALDSALDLVRATRQNHPADRNRIYEVVLMTDGDWNCPDSINQADCDGDPGETDEHPARAAAALLAAGVRVHVLAFGDATAAADLDQVAMSGGTGSAVDAASPEELSSALSAVVQEVKDAVVVPECIGGLPRVMIVLDASSSMFGGGGPGQSNWDKARFALAGNPDAPNPGDPGYVQPLFDRTVRVGPGSVTIEDVTHIGVIGFNDAATQRLMLQYAPCARDNIEWAMDPFTSCIAPGCSDPYTDPDTSLVWTFRNSDTDRNPPFAQRTLSFAPACNPGGNDRCSGLTFNTYTGEGLSFSRVNMARYMADSGPFNLDSDTPFVNILITDGETSPDSLPPEPILADMLGSGVATHVIGFGSPADLDEAQLEAYARAGGTAQAITVDPTQGDSANALSNRIAEIIGSLAIDPCCQLNDCSEHPEPALPLCGNGTVDEGETCDEGSRNGALRGTCNASCTSTAYCGDGVVAGAEICDDENRNDADSCRNDCSGICGDGITSGPEQCDDENDDETDGCRSDCTRDRDYPSGGGGTSGAGASGAGAQSGFGANGAGAFSGSGASTGSGATTGSGASSSGSGVNGSSGSTGSGIDGSGVDGGTADGGGALGGRSLAEDTGGCGCRTPGRHSRASRAGHALWLFGIAWGVARRRRGRARR